MGALEKKEKSMIVMKIFSISARRKEERKTLGYPPFKVAVVTVSRNIMHLNCFNYAVFIAKKVRNISDAKITKFRQALSSLCEKFKSNIEGRRTVKAFTASLDFVK